MNALNRSASEEISRSPRRLSRTAKAISELFQKSPPHRSFSTYEIFSVLANLQPKPSLSSIYRNLRSLTERGYLTEIFLPSGSEFVLLAQEISGFAQLHCSICNQTERRFVSPILIGNITKSFADVSPEKIQLELTVVCENCTRPRNPSNVEVCL